MRLIYGLPLVILLAGGAVSFESSLRDVLARAGVHAVSSGEALASVVADEEFVQELVRRDGTVLESRTLQSELAFVHLAGSTEWLAFRSVLRVDGRPVEEAGELERIFRDSPRSALAQARAITTASARYNLGPVQRNFNVPTTILQFVLPQHQERFRFRKRGEEQIDGTGVWAIEFRERRRGTFIRTPEGRDAPAEGRLWIVPADGRLLRSRLTVRSDVEAEVAVDWTHEPRLDLWVPRELRERYRGPWRTEPAQTGEPEPYDVDGVARYSNYRRFEVDVRIGR